MKTLSSSKAPKAIGPYSQAVKVKDFIYTSGTLPVDPETSKVVEGGIKEQSIRVFENLKGLLEDVGSSLDNIIKTTCFLKNMEDFKAFNEVYSTYVNKDAYPSRSTVEVARLPLDVLVEVEVIALIK